MALFWGTNEEGIDGESVGGLPWILEWPRKESARASGSIVPRIWAGNQGVGTDLRRMQAGVLRSCRTDSLLRRRWFCERIPPQ